MVTCVLLEGSRSSPAVVDAFDLKTPADDPMDQLQDLARALASKLSGLEIDAAIIRLADRSPQADQTTAPRRRLLIEGALALSCREKTPNVQARSGRELGARRRPVQGGAVRAGPDDRRRAPGRSGGRCKRARLTVTSRGNVCRSTWGPEFRQQVQAAVASRRNVVSQEMHHCSQYMLCALSADLASSCGHGRATRKVDIDHEDNIVLRDRLRGPQAPESIRREHQRCTDQALR